MNLTTLIFVIVLFVVTSLLYVGTTRFLIKRGRKGRHPINRDIKLLRQPGEGLREQLEIIDEEMSDEIVKGLVAPILVFAAPLLALNWFEVVDQMMTVVGFAFFAYFISLGYRVRIICRQITKRKHYELGLVGERVVADSLEPLKRKGYHVFHDAPAQGAQKKFNLDHVVVGPTGLFCIETKARTKYAAKDGGEDHKVRFDGDALIWPNGRETESVKQAREGTIWLEKWIYQRLGRRIAITPLLAIPGWYTDETLHGNLRVLSQKRLEHHILRGTRLDDETVNLIARQLDSLCRSVPCEG